MKKFFEYSSLLLSLFTEKSLCTHCVFDDLCLHICAIIGIQEIHLENEWETRQKLISMWFKIWLFTFDLHFITISKILLKRDTPSRRLFKMTNLSLIVVAVELKIFHNTVTLIFIVYLQLMIRRYDMITFGVFC